MSSCCNFEKESRVLKYLMMVMIVPILVCVCVCLYVCDGATVRDIHHTWMVATALMMSQWCFLLFRQHLTKSIMNLKTRRISMVQDRKAAVVLVMVKTVVMTAMMRTQTPSQHIQEELSVVSHMKSSLYCLGELTEWSIRLVALSRKLTLF